jgi:hypothetical protein
MTKTGNDKEIFDFSLFSPADVIKPYEEFMKKIYYMIKDSDSKNESKEKMSKTLVKTYPYARAIFVTVLYPLDKPVVIKFVRKKTTFVTTGLLLYLHCICYQYLSKTQSHIFNRLELIDLIYNGHGVILYGTPNAKWYPIKPYRYESIGCDFRCDSWS